MPNLNPDDTIAAIATPIGEGGLSVIRMSGPDSIRIASEVFFVPQKNVSDFLSHTLHLGEIKNEGRILSFRNH